MEILLQLSSWTINHHNFCEHFWWANITHCAILPVHVLGSTRVKKADWSTLLRMSWKSNQQHWIHKSALTVNDSQTNQCKENDLWANKKQIMPSQPNWKTDKVHYSPMETRESRLVNLTDNVMEIKPAKPQIANQIKSKHWSHIECLEWQCDAKKMMMIMIMIYQKQLMMFNPRKLHTDWKTDKVQPSAIHQFTRETRWLLFVPTIGVYRSGEGHTESPPSPPQHPPRPEGNNSFSICAWPSISRIFACKKINLL